MTFLWVCVYVLTVAFVLVIFNTHSTSTNKCFISLWTFVWARSNSTSKSQVWEITLKICRFHTFNFKSFAESQSQDTRKWKQNQMFCVRVSDLKKQSERTYWREWWSRISVFVAQIISNNASIMFAINWYVFDLMSVLKISCNLSFFCR